jgi:hypothetical protein
MSKTINRIIHFISEMGMSARQFDLSIGTANGYILRMEKNNASVGSDVIERIAKKYPKINLVWLITGEGEMFVTEPVQRTEISDFEVQKIIQKEVDSKLLEQKEDLLKDILREIDSALKEKTD